ncbi:hypothetical protein [Acetobacter sp. UBA5411]|uniref:hypothetical protein n=1 Tax=Acetobacter sp. UBA5411 TaxID=1945905 RepID=UPI0025BCE842|nr:hypothetical protein [Acetobacter sp. UBA5411]
MTNPETWPECLTEKGRENANAPPRDWGIACARMNLLAGVPLTEAQRKLVERAG